MKHKFVSSYYEDYRISKFIYLRPKYVIILASIDF